MKKNNQVPESESENHLFSFQTFSDTFKRSLTIVIGIVASIIIAEICGVEFASSTGVVALLGIQSTRKDTLKTALKRTVSFIYSMFFSCVIHYYNGVGIDSFAIVILIVVFVSLFLKWEGTLSINTVLIVHLFMQQEPFTTALLLNETKRIAIGVIIALLVNWKKPSANNYFHERIQIIESDIRAVLNCYEQYLNGEIELSCANEPLNLLEIHIGNGLNKAYVYANNNLVAHSKYYIHYMIFRQSESHELKNIYGELSRMIPNSAESQLLIDYMKQLYETLPVNSNFDTLAFAHKLSDNINSLSLPTTSVELSSLSAFISISNKLSSLSQLKYSFVCSISDKQRKLYWE